MLMGESALLFINKRKEVVQKFLDAIKDRGILADTAENGIEAAALLKKKEYQVVVTGTVLDGYNGEQIISYINRVYPDTICIVYTTALNAAQIRFFVNKRDVFRIIRRSVNFTPEFFTALEEAFEYYGVKKQCTEEKEKRSAQIAENERKTGEIKRKLERLEDAKPGLVNYMKRLTRYTLGEYNANMNKEERKKLSAVEDGMIDLCGGSLTSLERAENAVQYLQQILPGKKCE